VRTYNHVVDAGAPANASLELHLARLISVELRHPVLVRRTTATKLKELGLVETDQQVVEAETVKGRMELCQRVRFTELSRRTALNAWDKLCAAKRVAQIAGMEGTDFTLPARFARLLEELGYVACNCVNPDAPETKRRYTMTLTGKGRQLLEG
jgi:hypothetical protein